MESRFPKEVEAFFRKEFRMHDVEIDWIKEHWTGLECGDAPGSYSRFFIQERQKRREIEAPVITLKRIQRILMNRFFYRFGAPRNAHGFVKNRSPRTNAQVHVDHLNKHPDNQNCLLQVDFKDFFHAVPVKAILLIISRILESRFKQKAGNPTSVKIMDAIANLCMHHGRLPMGAPTSPVISNLVMAKYDAACNRFCENQGWSYSRYADDITVGGPNANRCYPFLKKRAERYYGMILKEKKTRVSRRHRAMTVTGVVINSGEPTVSRKIRRRIRAQIHHTELALAKAHSPLGVDFRPVSLQVLTGRAGWVASVNPKHRKMAEKVRHLRTIAQEKQP